MKKPTFAWATAIATIMIPITPAADSGVRNPKASPSPATISVVAARRAWRWGHFIPIDPNQAAVPDRPPPPKILL